MASVRDHVLAAADEAGRRAKEARRRERAMRARAEKYEMLQAALLGQLGEAEDASDLTSDTVYDTPDTMTATEIEPGLVRRSRAILGEGVKRHPFVRALASRKLTVSAFAKTLGYSRTTVQSWYKGKGSEDARPIPKAAAEAIRAALGVPLGAWRRIV